MDDRTQALLNVAVFTPIALYAFRGKKPPAALVVASVIAGAAFFLRDLNTLLEPPVPNGNADQVAGLGELRRIQVVR